MGQYHVFTLHVDSDEHDIAEKLADAIGSSVTLQRHAVAIELREGSRLVSAWENDNMTADASACLCCEQLSAEERRTGYTTGSCPIHD